jgi:putative transposase
MQRRRFSKEQIVAILSDWDGGAKVADLVRRHNVTEQTLYRWKKRYGGDRVKEQRHATLEHENMQLRRIVVEQALSLQALRDLLDQSMR